MERFYAFVTDYQAHGNGKIVISAPNGAGANGAVTWIADRINAMGVSRDRSWSPTMTRRRATAGSS